MEWLKVLGPWGLFLYTFFGLIFYMPIGPDSFVILTTSRAKSFPILLLLSLIAGYMLASTINFFIGKGVLRIIKVKFEKGEKFVSKYGPVGIFIASITPLPLREVTICAGYLRMSYKKFILSLLAGILLRFSIEIIFAIKFL